MRGISSGCCRRFGNINRNAALLEHTICQCCCSTAVTFIASGIVLATLSPPTDGNVTAVESGCTVALGWCDDDDMKPGGGSTPSAISRARCKRAFLSQSSIGKSSGLNLFENDSTVFEMSELPI